MSTPTEGTPGPVTAWLVLILRLPPGPSSPRVRTWRKLRTLGAVALKGSVYLLPASPEHHEQFQWLAQDVKETGGEATLFQVDRIENLSSAEIVALFQDARSRDYRALGERYRRLCKGLDGKARRQRGERPELEIERLARELERVRRIDFFDAPAYQDVERAREGAERRLRPAETAATGAPEAPPLGSLRGSRWVTRPRPHIDRLASAWLIKRFVDPEAEFLFAPPDAFPREAIPFDAIGVDLGHQGEDCTFETILRRCGLRDRRLRHLAEIVHEADLHDGKFHREEAPGIDLALRGLLATLDDDQAVLAHGLVLFEGLYRSLGERGRALRGD